MAQRRSALFDCMKFLLILGVLLVHSNVSEQIPHTDANLTGRLISAFLGVHLGSLFVPGFFILSGYLYFRNVPNFTLSVYKFKLRRRFSTLVVPYILWNILCCFLLYFKFRVLGMSGLDVFTDQGINIERLLLGFIYIPGAEDMPYAFAFWFIRNLIVFTVLTPLVRVIASRLWLTICLLIVTQILTINLYGFQWFVIGSYLGTQNYALEKLERYRKYRYLFLILVLGLSVIEAYVKTPGAVWHTLFLLDILSLFFCVTLFSFKIVSNLKYKLMKQLVKSTFFIYAFHELFVTLAQKTAILICGDMTDFEVTCSTLLTFVIYIAVSFPVYLILHKTTPKLLMVLTGGRS